MDDDLHDEIDALALTIERQATRHQEFVDGLPDFDSKYRRMAEAEMPTPEELFH